MDETVVNDSFIEPDDNMPNVIGKGEKSKGKRYFHLGPISRGGMGEVFIYFDKSFGRQVAVKRVLPEKATAAGRERFIREVLITSRLEHPNIVPVYDLDLNAAEPSYVMKYVRGVTLHSIIKRIKSNNEEMKKRYPLRKLLDILRRVIDAVEYAHSMGVIHRDLKPENIMIGKFGEVFVMDWGLAKIYKTVSGEPFVDMLDQPPMDEDSDDSATTLTLQGKIMGTHGYMPPEQATGALEAMDERTDVYAIGCILFTMLTHKKPYSILDLDKFYHLCIQEKLTSPWSYMRKIPEHTPQSLKVISDKAMHPDPEMRYQSLGEFSGDLNAFIGGYAPTVEEAGFFRQLSLLIKRRKNESILTFIILAILIFGGGSLTSVIDTYVKKYQQEADAKKELVDLRITETKREWQSIYRSDFSRPGLEDHWDIDTLTMYYVKSQKLHMGNIGKILLKNSSERNLKVRFRLESPLRYPTFFICFDTAIDFRDRQGTAIFFNGDISRKTVLRINGAAVTYGKPVAFKDAVSREFVIEKKEGLIRIQVDGDLVLEHRSRNFPLPGPGKGLAIKTYTNSFVSFSDIEVERLSLPLKVDLSEVANALMDAQNHANAEKYLVERLRSHEGRDNIERYWIWLDLLETWSRVRQNFGAQDVLLLERGLTNHPFYRSKREKITTINGFQTLFSSLLLNSNIPKGDRGQLLRNLLFSLEGSVFADEIEKWIMHRRQESIPMDFLDIKGIHIKSFDWIKYVATQSLQTDGIKFAGPFPKVHASTHTITAREAQFTNLDSLIGTSVQYLDLTRARIDDHQALKHLPLKYLNLRYLKKAKIENLDFISNMPIESLDISGSLVTDLSPLKGKPINKLNLDNVQVMDLSPLRDCPIERLVLWNCPTKDIETLRHMPLQFLFLVNTPVENIDALRHTKKLGTFRADHSSIRSIEALKGLPLRTLSLSYTPLESLRPLKHNILFALNVDHSKIKSLSGLEQSSYLKKLDASFTDVSSLAPLRHLNLRRLDIEKTAVIDLEPVATHQLKKLNISNTRINDLDSLKHMPLKILTAKNLPISNIGGLKGLPLYSLDLHRCRQLSNLTPLKHTTVSRIRLSHTRVKDLSPLKDLRLIYLDINHTPVDDLSPLKDQPITHLDIRNTNIKDLSVITSFKLVELFLDEDDLIQIHDRLHHIKSLKTINNSTAKVILDKLSKKRKVLLEQPE